ncbi:hypothetical protein, partial [Escherichia coli]|uniref:hypothetical protein n=1 Tax=Escherichia coli TaxID=562 RepID=UPI001BC841F3
MDRSGRHNRRVAAFSYKQLTLPTTPYVVLSVGGPSRKKKNKIILEIDVSSINQQSPPSDYVKADTEGMP